ncbi:TonB-dependent receptor [uncultured Desulfobacter sp.]|uniref:TonB-dependent receptor plug domain-containing protein n=1 Tax=uncultured Desulfobacter sp. TaxID=240139 RepID=UPI0029C67101|nr:TonB-dependent receptor [uncultured Desulfobacter sp.]
MSKSKFILFIFLCFLTLCKCQALAAQKDIFELSMEELMDIEVTSVAKKSQNLSNSAAAIHVITNEDIKRSGVTNIPDALRMVPGITVARIDANKWAVSARGFAGRFANALLVLIDGRSVYTPAFSGVYWEINDVLLEDVDRIEVIRGPGATVWGANAVNGVINIITKHAGDTQGGYVALGSGNHENIISGFRYGDALGQDTFWRFYAKHQSRDEFTLASGSDAGDAWTKTQAGFRLDSMLSSKDSLTVQGDIYEADIDQTLLLAGLTPPTYLTSTPVETDIKGWNFLSRWKRTISPDSDFTLQVYYDGKNQAEDINESDRDTFDIDATHRFALGESNDIVWGIRYRYTRDRFSESYIVSMDPTEEEDHLFSGFFQDEISLADDAVKLTLGSKIEHNEYSHMEIQPSIRALWAVNNEHKIWGAVSRAVRTPSRFESDAEIKNAAFNTSRLNLLLPPGLPLTVVTQGNEDYDSEKVTAYELGYRFIPVDSFSMDLAVFFNAYDDLRIAERSALVPTPGGVTQYLTLTNEASAETYGLEFSLKYKYSDFFQGHLAYSFLEDKTDGYYSFGFPRHQISLQGDFAISKNMQLNLWFRFVDEMHALYAFDTSRTYEVDSYLTMDVRFAWQIMPDLELSVVGQNLLRGDHVEFVQESFSAPVEVGPSAYCKLTYRF